MWQPHVLAYHKNGASPTGAVSIAFSSCSNTSTPEPNPTLFVPLLCRLAVLHHFGSKVVTNIIPFHNYIIHILGFCTPSSLLS